MAPSLLNQAVTMMKSLLVLTTIAASIAFSVPAIAANVCVSQDKDTILRHFLGSNLDLKANSTKTLARQFRDNTFKAFPSPDDIASAQITIPKLMKIRGVQTQFGLYPGAYRYDVLNENGVAVIEVRVQLKNATASDRSLIASRLQGAENIWNMTRPRMAFEFKFRFKLVDSKDDAHYHVNAKRNTRGPYFKNWDTDSWWTAATQAHEMGHMMGLSDEYGRLSGSQKDCSLNSLWCNEGAGYVDQYHYYFVLRRVVMQASGCKIKSEDKNDDD